MEQDHLPCSCDQEVFERVWRRVMPEDRPDCPFTLGEDAAAPPAVQPPAAALPAVVHTAPAGEQAPSRPVVGEEHDVPCLGASSAVYVNKLKLWKYATSRPVSLRGCWHAPRTCPHMWTDCMRETAVRNPESDWTARMSACALTSRRVPCRPSAIPDGWRSPASSASSITSPKTWRG